MSHRPLPTDVDLLVRERVGLSSRVLSRPEARRAFDHTLSRSGHADELAYARALRHDPALFSELVDALTVSESYFLRDPNLFRFLGEELIRRATRPFSLWSAGCAGGEELHSVALVCDQRGLTAKARLVGSDVAPSVVARARLAEYGAWSLRGVPEEVLARFFEPLPARRYRFVERLARRAHFYVHSLVADVPAPQRESGFDIVLCRNVLIYLDADGVACAGRNLAAALAPGGLLITGPSDPELPDGFLPSRTPTSFGVVYSAEPRGLPKQQSTVRLSPAATAPQEFRAVRPPEPAPSSVRLRHAPAASLVAPPAPEAAEDPALSAASQMKRAAELIDAGELAGAASALRAALYLDASLSLAHLMSGWVCRLQGDSRRARAAFERVLHSLEGLPGDRPVPLADGLTVAELERIVRADLLDQHELRRQE